MTQKGKFDWNRLYFSGIAFIVVAAITIWSSYYGTKVIGAAEAVRFNIAVPAPDAAKTAVQSLNASTVVAKPVNIDVGQQGWLKNLFNPGIVTVATKSIVNSDKKPHRIGLKLADGDVKVRPSVSASIPWDDATQSFSKVTGAGQPVPGVSATWYFYVPEEIRAKPVWYDGGLIVSDADTGEALTYIPITFKNGGVN